MDELLMNRVKQLKEIEERLDRIEAVCNSNHICKLLNELRRDVYIMVTNAEQEHADF